MDNPNAVPPVETGNEELNIVPPAPLEQELAILQNQFVELEAEKTRIAVERENYRKGMLKAKGKLPDDETDILPEDDRVRAIFREEMLNTQEAKIAEQNSNLVKSLLKKNEEMATALKNRTQMTPSGGNSSGGGASPENRFWTPEQEANLKARGLDPEKVKQNIIRNREKAGV